MKIKFASRHGQTPGGHAGSCWLRCRPWRSALIAGFSVFGYYYFEYRGIVDERLKQPIFADTAKIYAAPREVRPGQKLSVQLIANELRQAGYTTDGAAQASPLGTYSEGDAGRSPCIPGRSPITRRTRHDPRERRRRGFHRRRQGPAAFELRA